MSKNKETKQKAEEIDSKKTENTAENTERLKRYKDIYKGIIDFNDLKHLQHPVEYLMFAEWMALPRKDRVPKTQYEFAKQFGLNKDTVTDWKKRSDFWDIVSINRINYVREGLGSAFKSTLDKIIKTGNARDLLAFMQVIGDFKTKLEVESRTSKNNLSDEEVETLRRSLKLTGLEQVKLNDEQDGN